MRVYAVVVLGMVLVSGRVWAQEDSVASATTALQSVLSTLKQSVDKLSLDNDQLSARDNAVRDQVLQLQAQLGRLEAQGGLLDKSADKLQDKNPRRAQEIARLEEENFELDNRTQKDEGAVKLIQESLDAGYQEDQKLLLQLKTMSGDQPAAAPEVQSPASQEAVHLQKEKLKLMKMIYDSQQRQEGLHESILIFQKSTPLLPAANALAHQQILKEQIKDLESQLATYPQKKPSAAGEFADQWDSAQVRQLEVELKSLEKNYAQLKNLMDEMDKKAQAARMTVSEHVEDGKLQGSIDDLNHQAQGLRASLDDLRSQMVELDKRKSHLEEMIDQMPND